MWEVTCECSRGTLEFLVGQPGNKAHAAEFEDFSGVVFIRRRFPAMPVDYTFAAIRNPMSPNVYSTGVFPKMSVTNFMLTCGN